VSSKQNTNTHTNSDGIVKRTSLMCNAMPRRGRNYAEHTSHILRMGD